MCAQFSLVADAEELIRYFLLQEIDADLNLPTRFLPGSFAPILLLQKGRRRLEKMRFSMIPAWSKEKQLKFATHNARIEGIETKPTWKKVFIERHCVVPLSFFVEPAYRGPLAGNMIRLGAREPLAAAGLWDEWVNREDGEIIRSFAILTHEPSDQIREYGHDRSPVFLKPQALDEWLESEARLSASDVRGFIQKNSFYPELEITVDRPLKEGWQKK